MTDKVLEQVEAVLSGKRVKFLDPTRKAVLALPNAAFKVWMAYWMHESDGQEAYPEMDTLVRVTGMGENTIRRARKYLLDTGWLIQLDGSAGSRFARATNGAWNIMVYRVNDPTSKLEPSTQEMTGQNLTVPKNTPSFLEPNVASAFAVASTGTTAFTGTTSSSATDTLATPHTPCVHESLAPPITSLREKEPAPSEAKPERQQPVSTPPITALPPTRFDPDEDDRLPDEPPRLKYALADFECGFCDATFPGNHKGGVELDKHLYEAHKVGKKPQPSLSDV